MVSVYKGWTLYLVFMDILSSLNWRYATKQFDPSKQVSSEDIQTLIESARLAPTSFGLPSVRLVHVTSSELRAQLREASWGQSQITDASDLFVLAVPKNFGETELDAHIKHLAEARNQPIESFDAYKQMVLGHHTLLNGTDHLIQWLQKQAYIALGFVMLSAAEMRIDTCPIEGMEADKYDQILWLSSEGYRTSVVLAVGYRSPDDTAQNRVKVRPEMADFLITK